MAITSGVRAPRAQVSIGGMTIEPITAHASQEATKRSSTMSAMCALDDFGGDQFFGSLSDNSGSIMISGQTLCDGEWDHVGIDYDERVVRLSGRDKSAKLHEQKSSEKFKNQKRSEIVQTVAKRNGLTAQVDAGKLLAGKIEQIDWSKLTDGVSDAAILHKLAELEGARWWVKNGMLHFKSKSSGGGYSVQYQAPSGSGPATGNFLRLQISLNLQAAKTLKCEVKSWHSKKKELIQASKSLNGNGGTLTYRYRSPGMEQDHADDLALKKLAEHSRHELTIHVEMVGDPSIDIGMGLQLQGTAFDQSYDMDRIDHTIGPSGHTMSIEARSAKQGREAQ